LIRRWRGHAQREEAHCSEYLNANNIHGFQPTNTIWGNKKAYLHELIIDFKRNNSIVNSIELFLYLLQDSPWVYDQI